MKMSISFDTVLGTMVPYKSSVLDFRILVFYFQISNYLWAGTTFFLGFDVVVLSKKCILRELNRSGGFRRPRSRFGSKIYGFICF